MCKLLTYNQSSQKSAVNVSLIIANANNNQTVSDGVAHSNM